MRKIIILLMILVVGCARQKTTSYGTEISTFTNLQDCYDYREEINSIGMCLRIDERISDCSGIQVDRYVLEDMNQKNMNQELWNCFYQTSGPMGDEI